jgi:hypothetical protein
LIKSRRVGCEVNVCGRRDIHTGFIIETAEGKSHFKDVELGCRDIFNWVLK